MGYEPAKKKKTPRPGNTSGDDSSVTKQVLVLGLIILIVMGIAMNGNDIGKLLKEPARVFVRPTHRPTPRPSLEKQITNRIRRYHKDVSIKSVIRRGKTTVISYNFIPWALQRNENIAHQVVFKVLCSARQLIPGDAEFIGYVRMTDDYGKRSYEKQVEIHLSASTLKKLSCGGDWNDINWEKVADLHKTHRLPADYKLDYGTDLAGRF